MKSSQSPFLFDQQGLVALCGLSPWLAPAHVAVHEYVLGHSVIGADETFWRVMEGSGENKRWQTWAVVAPKAVSYRIRDSRSAVAASEVLGEFAGTLLIDGYTAYSALQKRGGRFELAHCWAHVRRKFVEAQEVHPEACAEALDLIGQLYTLERDCGTDEDRARVRGEQSREVVPPIQAWALQQRALPQSPLGKAIAYMGELWPGLVKFIEEPRLALDSRVGSRRGGRFRSCEPMLFLPFRASVPLERTVVSVSGSRHIKPDRRISRIRLTARVSSIGVMCLFRAALLSLRGGGSCSRRRDPTIRTPPRYSTASTRIPFAHAA